MSNFLISHFHPHSSFELHKIQEEVLRELEEKFPNAQNLKIKLTYERALSELYNLSKMPEYEKFFHPILEKTEPSSCPKVLGAFFDKIEGSLRVALLEGKKEDNLFQYREVEGKLIHLSVKETLPIWRSLEPIKWGRSFGNPTRDMRVDHHNFAFSFQENFSQVDVNFLLSNDKIDPHPTEVSPKDSIYSYAEDPYLKIFFHEIKSTDMDNIYANCNRATASITEYSHRCFYIDYNEIENVVKQPSNPFEKGEK